MRLTCIVFYQNCRLIIFCLQSDNATLTNFKSRAVQSSNNKNWELLTHDVKVKATPNKLKMKTFAAALPGLCLSAEKPPFRVTMPDQSVVWMDAKFNVSGLLPMNLSHCVTLPFKSLLHSDRFFSAGSQPTYNTADSPYELVR